uniref:uncharacterized protein LOC122609461 n=1 Tax=Erigeron canadensis TaxID=72917 RepID=UPI001CB9B901|nr:uncharacterized protein LOC122609461 [Erigeron canadensis]
MEGLSTKVYNGVKCYWRRRGYQRLGTSTASAVHNGHAEAVPDAKRRRRKLWRININPRLRIKVRRSPKKFFLGLRDAYVKIMMKLANTSVVRGRTMTGYNVDGFGKTTIKEYDEKMIIEIYKVLAIKQNHQHEIQSRVVCSV